MALRLKFLPLLAVAAALVAGGLVGRATAQTAEPGTGADPLVSKSYVDQATLFRVVEVPAGQVILGEAGTEMVLRSGKATAIVSPQGGLLDVTGGTDTPQGAPIPANHLIIIPRSDGRGFHAVTNLVLMVKGRVSIGPAQ